jgi:hypothetical protein
MMKHLQRCSDQATCATSFCLLQAIKESSYSAGSGVDMF